MNADADDLDRLRRMLDAAQRIVFFTGAGISTESGIPDFRSPGTGLWTKMKPIMFQDFIASDSIRQESWRRRFTGERTIETAKPNKGHEAIAKLIRDGKATSVITQNVDNLHQNSGIDPEPGHRTARQRDLCEMSRLRHAIRTGVSGTQFADTGRVAPCAECGGIVKTATISFGQSMPEREMRLAQQQTMQCDLFVVVGSSLVVYPAAGFPELAKDLGAKLVIVNREPTPLDPIADLVVHREIGPTLSFAVGIN